jgi:hypothetical protein
MKIFKNYCVCALILILSFCLSSCNKDQSQKNKSDSSSNNISGNNGDLLNLPLSKDGHFSNDQNNLTELNKYIQIPNWISLNKDAQVMKIETPQSLTLSALLISEKSKEETQEYWLNYFKSKGYEEVKAETEEDNSISISGKNKQENLSVFLDKGRDKLMVNIVYIKAMI